MATPWDDTELFGRDALLAEMLAALQRADVVISGPPGVGKTTMARALAQRATGRAVFCDLTEARSADEFLEVVGRALDLVPRAGSSRGAVVERLCEALTSDQLVVLDNIDHVGLDGHKLAAQLPARKVVTSRSPVPLEDAAQFAVEPLDEDAAVALFAARARAIAPGFAVGPQNEDTVRELVRRLDRLPLAVELAAARAHVLSPAQILQRMDDRLATLRDQRTGRSLVSALEWTWDLASEPEKRCLAQCAVFRGEFGIDDVEAVVRVEGADVLDALDRLVTAGWVRARWGASGERRFALFESVRDFAERRLDATEQERLRSALAMHATRTATRLAAAVEGRDGVAAFAQLRERTDLLRWSAQRWLELRRPEAAEVLVALTHVILLDSRVIDWAELVDRAGELAEEHDLVVAVRLLQLRGQMHLLARQLPAAEDALRRAHALAGQLPDDHVRLDTARTLAIAVAGRDPAAAAEMLDTALARARHLGGELQVARILERLGFVRNRLFALDEAYDAFEEAHDIFLRVSNPLFAADCLTGMAYVAWRRGDLASAQTAFARAVQMHAQAGNRAREASARFNLGAVLHELGALDAAATEYEAALEGWRELALGHLRVAALVRQALLECERGASEGARRIAQQARAEAAKRNDQHNAALAEGVLALTRLQSGRSADASKLEYTLATLNMGAAPIAVGAHIAMLATLADDAAKRDDLLGRIDELRSLASDQDAHVDRTLLAVDHIAHGLAAITGYTTSGARGGLGLVRVGLDAASGPGARHSPYARLLGAWLVRRSEVELVGVDLEGGRTLRVHPEAHWFRLDDGEVVDLTTRKPLRLLLRHFVELSQHDRLAGTPVAALVEVGWPDEAIAESAGKNRVYTAIRFLREMGLEDVLVTGDSGYQISPEVRVQVEAP